MTKRVPDLRVNSFGVNVDDIQLGQWLCMDWETCEFPGLFVGWDKEYRSNYRGERVMRVIYLAPFDDGTEGYISIEETQTKVKKIIGLAKAPKGDNMKEQEKAVAWGACVITKGEKAGKSRLIEYKTAPKRFGKIKGPRFVGFISKDPMSTETWLMGFKAGGKMVLDSFEPFTRKETR